MKKETIIRRNREEYQFTKKLIGIFKEVQESKYLSTRAIKLYQKEYKKLIGIELTVNPTESRSIFCVYIGYYNSIERQNYFDIVKKRLLKQDKYFCSLEYNAVIFDKDDSSKALEFRETLKALRYSILNKMPTEIFIRKTLSDREKNLINEMLGGNIIIGNNIVTIINRNRAIELIENILLNKESF